MFHYVPLHTSPMGAEFGYKKGDLPVTEDLAERLVRLPFYHEMFLVPAVPLLASSARIG